MPHATTWTCGRCRRVLGTIERGVLHVERPFPYRVLPNGWLAAKCPGPDCTAKVLWKPPHTRALDVVS